MIGPLCMVLDQGCQGDVEDVPTAAVALPPPLREKRLYVVAGTSLKMRLRKWTWILEQLKSFSSQVMKKLVDDARSASTCREPM